MPVLRLLLALLVLVFVAQLGPAMAQADTGGDSSDAPLPFPPKGLAEDASRYRLKLTAKKPPQPQPQAIEAALKSAAAAMTAGESAKAVAAYEQAIGLGEERAETWLALGRAWRQGPPANRQRAAEAAWLAYIQTPGADVQRQALLQLADVLETDLKRPRDALATLQHLRERGDKVPAELETRIAALRQQIGLELRNVRTESDGDRPRVCLEFSSALERKQAARFEDYLSIEPAEPLAAIADGRTLCLGGPNYGATYRINIREGLRGAGGVVLTAPLSQTVTLGEREASVAFRSGPFLLPRHGPDGVPVTTVNVDAVRLVLYRVHDRSLAAQLADDDLLSPLYRWTAERLEERSGEKVWSGRMEVQRQRNVAVQTAIPLKAMLGGPPKPGLYVLTAEAADRPESSLPSRQATQWLLISDTGLTTMRGADGITVFARSLSTAKPSRGVTLALIARNNAELARTTTDEIGRGQFPPAVSGGAAGNAPALVMAYGDDGDFAVLDLTRPGFDLSDRGVGGRPMPRPLDAYLYPDRGVYRPGETVNVTALLRNDSADAVAGFPLTMRVLRPNGTVYQAGVVKESAPGAFVLPVTVSASAPLGTWQVEALGDAQAPPIGRMAFQVEAFIPERLAVKAEPSSPVIRPPEPFNLNVISRFLYGPPAAGLDGSVEVIVRPDPKPFAAHAGYRFGLAQETLTPRIETLALPASNAEGLSKLEVRLPPIPDTTLPLQAEFRIAVAEPGGRPTRQTLSVPVRSQPFAIGIRPMFEGDRIAEGADARVEVIAVDAAGKVIAKPGLQVVLYEEHIDYIWFVRGGGYSFKTSLRSQSHEQRRLDAGADTPAALAFGPLGYGRYRIEVSDPATGAASSVRFSAGWQVAATPSDRPDTVEVTADQPSYLPGGTVRLRISAPFAGEALVTAATDRVLAARNVAVPEGGATLELRVTPEWKTGAYVLVNLYRPPVADRPHQPVRAIGLVWLPIDPAPRKLDVAIETPAQIRPRQTVDVPVRVTAATDRKPVGDVWVTLAAVDEGILQLTDFASPDPQAFYLGKRRLGLDIRDDYSRLIDPLAGPVGVLRQGGDTGSLGVSLPDVPVTIVSLFAGPVRTDSHGLARVPISVPDFNGQLRLMAVAFDRTRIGASATPLIVRDPLVAEMTLPRFLAPGDESRVTVSVHNVEAEPGPYRVDVRGQGAVAVSGGPFTLDLARGARATVTATLTGATAGTGTVTVGVQGPGGVKVERSLSLSVRPSRPVETTFSVQRLPPGASSRSGAALLAGYVPGTAALRLTYSARPPFDVAGLAAALDRYPYGCLEQVISRALPLLVAGRIEQALGPGRAGDGTLASRIQEAVANVLDKQSYTGAFGLWSASAEDQPWLSAYAMDFLTRAREKGHAVPDGPFAEGLEWLRRHAIDGGSEPASLASRAYALHVLALAGVATPGSARYLADTYLDRLPTPLAKAQLAAALARLGDRDRAEAAAAKATANLTRDAWAADYGSTVRDAAAMITVLGEVKLLPPDRLDRLIDRLPANALGVRDTNTQDQAWLLLAADALLAGRNPPVLKIDGTARGQGDPVFLAPTANEVSAGVQVANAGTGDVWQVLTLTGVPSTPQPAIKEGLQVKRQFLTPQGAPVNLDAIRQNDVFVIVVEGSGTAGIPHQALLTHGLPAGWEIENLLAGEEASAGMPWLGELTEPVAMEARDDRFVAAVDLDKHQPSFRLAYRVRAVTPGRYELPGAQLEDMYKPRFLARQAAGHVTVLPAP